MKQPLIKWTGSKLAQTKEIIKHIPKSIDTYYEPFLGGGSVAYALMENNSSIEKYVLSDMLPDCINLHKYLLYSSDVIERYEKMRNNLMQFGMDYYYEVRSEYNKTKEPSLFLFLNRNSANGLIRFNNKGEYNAPFHHTRIGIEPKILKNIVDKYKKIAENKDICFLVQDYYQITPNENDFIYLDPPYTTSDNKLYGGTVNPNDIQMFIELKNAKKLLSFNAIRGEDDFEFDFKGYTERFVNTNKNSSFGKLFKNAKNVQVSEYLYKFY